MEQNVKLSDNWVQCEAIMYRNSVRHKSQQSKKNPKESCFHQ